MMKVLRGEKISAGTVIGPLWLCERRRALELQTVIDIEQELSRFRSSKHNVKEQLKKMYGAAMEEVGEKKAAIFEVHQMLLDDPEFAGNIEELIKAGKTAAEQAVNQVGKQLTKTFLDLNDDYMKARAADIKDIVQQLLADLQGHGPLVMPEGKFVVAAEEITPSMALQLDKNKVLGFVTTKGSSNSHGAILAKAMGVPAVVDIEYEFTEADNGKTVAVDGNKGIIYLDPEPETLAKLQAQALDEAEVRASYGKLIGQPTITTKGRRIELGANIGQVSDLPAALASDCEAIGLMRSEFLYLGKEDYPTEEEQFAAYKTVAEGMKGKKVIIRTMDIGADKTEKYFQLNDEENPALGFRAIRICLQRPDIFKTQLRAILRASAFGKIAIMFPMITDQGEVRAAKNFLAEAKLELAKKSIPFDKDLEVGIMMETPSAAVLADELAKEVDFFSIGTNDLTQYVLAADRSSGELSYLIRPNHPAVLRLIKRIIDEGHKAGIKVGICGEAAGDFDLTETFVKMGIDELSVAPTKVLQLRALIRSL
jgi:phosphotransferase system enzyme I (PtsI)